MPQHLRFKRNIRGDEEDVLTQLAQEDGSPVSIALLYNNDNFEGIDMPAEEKRRMLTILRLHGRLRAYARYPRCFTISLEGWTDPESHGEVRLLCTPKSFAGLPPGWTVFVNASSSRPMYLPDWWPVSGRDVVTPQFSLAIRVPLGAMQLGIWEVADDART